MKRLIEFENIIKELKCMFFGKVYEKTQDGWKVIYNMQGLIYKNKFYSNIKIIFWLNKEKTQINQNVITYLYSLYCDYKTTTIDKDLSTKTIVDNIFRLIREEKTNSNISEFVESGTDKFNEILKQKDLKGFVEVVKFIPHGNKSCIDTYFNFKIDILDIEYEFKIKCYKNKYELTYKDEVIDIIKFDDMYKKIIELIYK